MNNRSQSSLFKLNKNQIATIGLIIKIPKDYLPGKVIINLVALMQIKLNLVGMIAGTETDQFNWLSLKATGTMDNLINSLIYLNSLKIETSFLNFNQNHDN
ncbi:hypothetical protein Sta7437_3272 [Stanieria cyanosphaera PCC 7437]|uniref:NIL domain-containing protein n=1 Tax=Stanieria cyanosphaera (strain ATCC 29371 / PCC 7437) TaxID=111780 RepID=K9XXJ4_STAC7|nr:hypothetical protein [Stanieria cyanosphaera]AFZ36779.1 hypothetical protein Sta7437_3272 [Stanieria cyanosphaera PCC 7437]